MRTILILNPKGGCGKSTIATNIAGYFAIQGKNVALADCDPQYSSNDWLSVRPLHLPRINHVPVKKSKLHVPYDTEILILDTPASMHDQKMSKIINAAQTMIIPVLPSPVDMRAAERFIKNLIKLRKKTANNKIKIATVANRVSERTIISTKLGSYLEKIKLPNGKRIPFMTLLRASQNYVHASEKGMTIFEMMPSKTHIDREQWQPLIRWLTSKKSLP